MEIRCKKCGKLLGKFEGVGEVKCTRTGCGEKNIFNTKTGNVNCVATNHVPMRNRTTSSGHTFR